MSLVTRFSLFFLIALALALGAFSACLYYLVGFQLRVALDEDLEATLDGFPTTYAAHSSRVTWALYGEDSQRLEGPPGNDRAMILDGWNLTPYATDVATTIQTTNGQHWRILVRPFGGRRRRGPREGHRPGLAKGDDERAKGKEIGELLPGAREGWPGSRSGPSLSPRDHGPPYLTAWTSLEPVEAQLRALAALLPLLSTCLWLLAAVAGRYFGRRALAPLVQMAGAARIMSWTDGNARLPKPETHDELEDFAASFNGLLDRLNEALVRQKQFTGQASHQLRTPLAALIARIDVSRRRVRTTQEYEHVLDRLHNDAQRLWHIVEALLFLARADAEAAIPGLEQINLSTWVIDRLQDWLSHERAPDLRGPEPSKVSVFVHAQPALLGQLLDNLLENACKYSAPGTPIDISLTQEPGNALLAVKDHGDGIPAEDLPHVFQPFYRSHQARLGQAGVGLGLAVVQRIATVLGGTVSVYSVPGQGSCFTLRLPVTRPMPATDELLDRPHVYA